MKQSEKLMQLLELMQANPELPVIPCVDGDVVSGDEYYCWIGSWGESAVQEFVVGRERTYYREDDILPHHLFQPREAVGHPRQDGRRAGRYPLRRTAPGGPCGQHGKGHR